MPYRPKKKKRSWLPERKQHQRVVDNSKFYNDMRWRRFSKQFKKDNPFCVECLKEGIYVKSTVTDHIKQMRLGSGADLNNLETKDFQALCSSHHNKKSAKEGRNFKE